MIKIFISDKVHVRKKTLHNQDRQECQDLIIFTEITKPDGPFPPWGRLAIPVAFRNNLHNCIHLLCIYGFVYQVWHKETLTQNDCSIRVIDNALNGLNINLFFEHGIYTDKYKIFLVCPILVLLKFSILVQIFVQGCLQKTAIYSSY